MRGADFSRAGLHRRCWRDDDIAALLGPADWRGPCAVTQRVLEYWDRDRVIDAEVNEPVFVRRVTARDRGEQWQAIKRAPPLLTAPQLMRRGWRAFDIRRHLGKPDGKAANGADGYRLSRIEAAEQSDPILMAAVRRNGSWGL